MPPYMPLHFDIVERRWNALICFWKSMAGDFSFFIPSLISSLSFSSTFYFLLDFFFHFLFFLRLFLLS